MRVVVDTIDAVMNCAYILPFDFAQGDIPFDFAQGDIPFDFAQGDSRNPTAVSCRAKSRHGIEFQSIIHRMNDIAKATDTGRNPKKPSGD